MRENRPIPVLDDHPGNAQCSSNVRTDDGLLARNSEQDVKGGGRNMEVGSGLAATQKTPLSGAAAELFDLQVIQFRHDEVYHREIARLTVQGRLNHMALHFCKYVGQLAEITVCADTAKLERTIVDTFIINLCAANALNVRLGNFIPDTDAASLADLSRKLALGASPLNDCPNAGFNWLLSGLAFEAGNVARACEKIDHLEAFKFRETIVFALGNIASLCLVAAYNFEFPLVYAVRKRLREVEEKFIFHNAL